MIAIGCDHGGYELKQKILAHLRQRGLEYRDFGCDSTASVDYPVYGKAVAHAVASGECEKGIVICSTGIGISIAANKVPGIRCALCGDCFSAKATRLHNNANVLALGALVTTHKLDLYHACQDLFDYVDPFAQKLGEVSSLSKQDGKFCAHAKDPISSGLALERFVPENYWKDYGGDVLLLGAGGSALAMSLYLTQEKFGDNVPGRIIIANRSQPRLDSAREILRDLNPRTRVEFVLNPTPGDNDRTLASLKPHSLIVNATGLGKDAPGSPLTDAARFPEDSLVWEINYRGDLLFKRQAEAQRETRRLHVEDGWNYFIYGWTQVIAQVFHCPIEGELLERLSRAAKQPGK